jgi:hypothetical protein
MGSIEGFVINPELENIKLKGKTKKLVNVTEKLEQHGFKVIIEVD